MTTNSPARAPSGRTLRDFPPGLLGVPTVDWMYTESALRLKELEKHLPPGSANLWTFPASSHVAANRNLLVKCLLQHPQFKWLLMIDSDMTPAPDLALRLLDRNVDIVGAPYFGRRSAFIPHWMELATEGEPPSTRAGFREVLFVGGGCMLITRRVLEAVGHPAFDYLQAPAGRHALAEDVGFCASARQAGFKIYLDDDAVCDHVGANRISRESAAAWWATEAGRAQYDRQTRELEADLRPVFTG